MFDYFRNKFLNRSLQKILKILTHIFYPKKHTYIYLFILIYNFILCKYTILTTPDSNESVGSNNSLYI
jgi:hypothetical protein